jgi:hypothetical protein
MRNQLRSAIIFFSLASCITACGSCRRPKVGDDGDAAVAASAAPSASDAPSAAASASAAPAASDQPSPNASAAAAVGGPFQGVYHCMNDLTLTQNGNHVSGITALKYNPHMSHEVTRVSCTVSGDKCVGTSTSQTEKDGKSQTKTPRTIGVTLTRRPNGDVGYMQTDNVGFPCAREK